MFNTLGELSAIIENEVGDRGGIFISKEDIVLWYNEAVVDIYVTAEVGRDSLESYSVNAGDTEIAALSAPGVSVQKIHNFVVDGIPLIQTNLAELYQLIGNNIDFSTQGQPRYYWRARAAGVTNTYRFKFYPAAQVNCTALISCTIIPPYLLDTAPSSTVLDDLPPVYNKDIIKYMVMRGNMKEKDFRAAELLEDQYRAGAAERYDNAHEVAEDFLTIRPDPMDGY